MKSIAFSKIVWAVDTMENPEHHRMAQFLIGALTRATSAEVYPVHVLGHPFVNTKEEKSDFEEAFQTLAEKRLRELVEKSDVVRMSPGQVLLNRKGSIKGAVELVTEYADKVGADAIVVATHGRSGMSRLFVGSFAETVLLNSQIPVLTVNPQTKVREKISNILFPTTFESKFREGFEKAVILSKVLDARLTAFYKEPLIPSPYMSPLILDYIDKEAVERKKAAEKWQTWAAGHGVPVIVHYDERQGHVADAISEFANERDFDLIAMVSQTDSFSVPFIGSHTRQLVRSSGCPVWVMKTDE